LVWSSRHADALALLLSVAEEAPRAGLPAAAWRVVALAANVAYQTGLPGDREAVLSALTRLEELRPPPEGQPEGTDELRLWIHGCLEPFTGRSRAVAWLRQVAAGPVANIPMLGAAAWMLDESELAITLLREALRRLRSNGSPGSSGAMLSAITWAFVDSGRWDEALAAASEASGAADVSAMSTVAASADLTVATVLALRGAHPEVQPYLDRALATVNPAEYRGFAARAWHAAGLAALGQGRHDAAYAQLSQLFDPDGRPAHHHVSYLALADLAAAAVRVYRGPETRALLERALNQADSGPRLEQIAARARCLLGESGDPGETGAGFAAALSGPAGDAWPFERAQLRLDYGEWLRRQRRINDAKPVLAAALEVFRRLGADPWTRRTQAELRACGVTAVTATGPQSTLDGLTAQQREIVILAGRGLTNNEIADRLFLSARTVASHLHRAYGKLGLAGRHQLRNLLDQAGEPPR
ncbi:MAG TPA: LuxR family transcriptional regulator, partial [Trebonia sp.]